MATPTTPKVIKITVTSGVAGQAITIFNTTTKETINTFLGDTAKAIVDLANFPSGWTTGDVIDISVGGENIGTGSLTLNETSAQSTTISTSSITSGLVRGI